MGDKESRVAKVNEVLEAVGIDPPKRPPPPARVLRRAVPAHLDRAGRRHRAEADHLRRAGLRARRVGAGADPQPARGHEGALRAHHRVHRPRPRGREERERPRGGHVPRQDVRGRRSPTTMYANPSHPYTAALLAAIPEPDPDDRPRLGEGARRRDPVTGPPAVGLPLPHPVPEGASQVRRRGADDARGRPEPLRGVPLSARAGRAARLRQGRRRR